MKRALLVTALAAVVLAAGCCGVLPGFRFAPNFIVFEEEKGMRTGRDFGNRSARN